MRTDVNNVTHEMNTDLDLALHFGPRDAGRHFASMTLQSIVAYGSRLIVVADGRVGVRDENRCSDEICFVLRKESSHAIIEFLCEIGLSAIARTSEKSR